MNASLLLPASTSPAFDDRVMVDALATSIEFDLLVRAHALLPTHSKRAIAAELKISRQRVDKLLALPRPAQANEPADIVQDLMPTLSRVRGVSRITDLATRPQGVKYKQYQHILVEMFGFVRSDEYSGMVLNMTPKDHSSIKHDVCRKAKRSGRVAVFVPEWMDTARPKECNQAMLNAVQALHDAMSDIAHDFCHAHPGNSFKSVMWEMTALAIPWMTAEPVPTRCGRNEAVAEALATNMLCQANGPTPLNRASQRVAQEEWPVAGPSDAELESLCI